MKYICGVAISLVLVWGLKEFGKLPIECPMDRVAVISGAILVSAFVWKMWFGMWKILFGIWKVLDNE